MIYYYSYKKCVMFSDPGNQLHWNEMYFQQISYWHFLPSYIPVVVYINRFLFVNPKNIWNDIDLFKKNINKK